MLQVIFQPKVTFGLISTEKNIIFTEKMSKNGLKVLLIDDTVMILQRLQSLLSEVKQVSRTESATSAEEALVLMDGYQPDVMVLDINMPGMGGIEMLRKLSVKQMIKPVVIMLTNNTFAGYRDECMRLGADYFLDKSRDFLMIPTIVEKVQERNVAISF
jgi:DNA-binding NarL/FixJ family response regulator